MVRRILILGAAAALAAVPALAAQSEAQKRRVTPIVEVVQRVGPAVVNISATFEAQVRDPFFHAFFGGGQRSQSLGSGVVIDPRGYVVTNGHVIQSSDSDVTVRIGKSEPVAAEVIWMDRGNDLALLQIRGGGSFPSARLGTSSDVMIGETVIALGNPYGFDNTVSQGIVSATDRALNTPTGASFVDFIQTDAGLHPGNSGGPLVNINGEVIGINTLVQTGTEAIGFAIPVDRVKRVLLERLTNYAQIRGVYLGARLAPGPAEEALVRFVEKDSPAERAGLCPGDVIRTAGGEEVATLFAFNTRMLRTQPGQELRLEVERAGKHQELTATLEPFNTDAEDVLWQRLGLQVTDRDAYNRRYKGVHVLRVQPNGPAERTGLKRGDFIYRAAGVEIDSYESFYYTVTESTAETLAIDVIRGRERYEGEIRLRPLTNEH